MLELPEAISMAKQLGDSISGKKICRVLPPTKVHKFCWFAGDPVDYDSKIRDSTVKSVNAFGCNVEITLDNGMYLNASDGTNVRFIDQKDVPNNYQLLMEFSDGTAIVFTVAMYGGIVLHDDSYDNEYYIKNKSAISPFSKEFEPYYREQFTLNKPKMSVKAFLATEQRFPGIGNGVLQDILFNAGINPKRKIGTLNDSDKDRLLSGIVSVLTEMTENGGRDTEKDLFGQPGGYKTKMSKNTVASPCPKCGGKIVKTAYMGGSVYYCPDCQPLESV